MGLDVRKLVAQKILITNAPPQSWSLYFFECQWKQKICITYYEKMKKNGSQFMETFQLPTPQKFESPLC